MNAKQVAQHASKAVRASSRNWKTTVTGMLAGAIVLLDAARRFFDGEDIDLQAVSEAVVGVAVILMGFFSRDADKTSEDSGV